MNGRLALLAGCLLLAGFLALASVPAQADDSPGLRPPRDHIVLPPRDFLRVRMDVLVDGMPLRVVHHAGRSYLVVPRTGIEYRIRVSNDGPRRISAVVSVDGLSVITNRPASTADPGYIVASGGHIVIPGWKRDRGTAAAFTFEERERSLAARLGYPENVGVLGLVAFEELAGRPRPFPMEKGNAGALRSSRAEVGGTGTGTGRDVEFHTYQVPFVRSGNQRAITLYYDTAEALRRAGVPVDRPWPMPFPLDR